MAEFIIPIKADSEILVDEIDYIKAINYKWNLRNRPAGIRSYPYTHVNGKELTFSKAVFDIDKGQSLYHKNGNWLDYRRDNLLICNKSQQGHQNAGLQNKTSKYTGVYYSQKWKCWKVKIIKDNKYHYIGSYKNEEDAAIVAKFFHIQFFEGHAKINFPGLSYNEFSKCTNKFVIIMDGHL